MPQHRHELNLVIEQGTLRMHQPKQGAFKTQNTNLATPYFDLYIIICTTMYIYRKYQGSHCTLYCIHRCITEMINLPETGVPTQLTPTDLHTGLGILRTYDLFSSMDTKLCEDCNHSKKSSIRSKYKVTTDIYIYTHIVLLMIYKNLPRN